MKLFRTQQGILIQYGQAWFLVSYNWDELINRDRLFHYLLELIQQAPRVTAEEAQLQLQAGILVPAQSQEVWGAGVTYRFSRDARVEESMPAGGGDFYLRAYEADRPEIFFKALPHRLAAEQGEVFIRRDSSWNVPEPELAIFMSSSGQIQGYTIGNDMSSRSIEGENPLYLPQAKIYDRSAALGPCLLVPEKPLPPETNITMQIKRNGVELFRDSVPLSRMKRSLPELAGWLFRECHFPFGCFLMTGTGIIPGNDFTLHYGDEIEIQIDHIGILHNIVGKR
ncbi:MAG TPA: fumarylacetoacetate hydrolase family protein [Chitinophagaceae bacterium]|jgi:2-dehydro-3-deoxy-D-arabinonate dehydratase|nr:fumarylacetoacetate hydrolase family protein [Chitinophagaceae bacterium]